MDSSAIEALLKEKLDIDEAYAKTDGSHVEVIVVGSVFENMSRVKKQQMIYGPLNPSIADGSIHAVSIKTFTPEEWERDKKLILPDA